MREYIENENETVSNYLTQCAKLDRQKGKQRIGKRTQKQFDHAIEERKRNQEIENEITESIKMNLEKEKEEINKQQVIIPPSIEKTDEQRIEQPRQRKKEEKPLKPNQSLKQFNQEDKKERKVEKKEKKNEKNKREVKVNNEERDFFKNQKQQIKIN